MLIYATYSGRNTQINLLVYYHIAVATVVGTAHHMVKQHENDKNIYAAWNAFFGGMMGMILILIQHII